jgi:tetratricopeptide (TPR) repeat protein
MELRQYTQAAEQFLNLSKIESGNESIRSLAKAAQAFSLDDKTDFAIDLLLNEFSKVLSIEEKGSLYLALANISKGTKNSFLFDAFAEKTLEYFPLEHDLRFSLAYHYGESGFEESSLFHYDILRARRPDGGCLNNIGIAYRHLKMKNKAVQSYKEAIDKFQETLAMANLASIHIEAGLLDEAEGLLEKATGIKDYHKNVDFHRNRVKIVREEEEKDEKRIIEESKNERKFLARFAEAYSLPHVVSITGDWESKHGVIPIKVEGKIISGQKDIEELPAAPAVNLLGTLAGMSPQSEKKRISLSGKINNRGIEYRLSIESLRPGQTLLGALGARTVFDGLMIISTDGQLMEVMEKDGADKRSFYVMKKVG